MYNFIFYLDNNLLINNIKSNKNICGLISIFNDV